MPVVPLPAGSVLADRFRIISVLGHGGFGIAYVADDLARQDKVVVKELAPEGSKRRADGFLDLQSGGLSPQLLRNRFADEANRVTKLRVKGVLPVRATVAENGTVYYATEYVAEAETLEQILVREGRFGIDHAVNVLVALLHILDGIHRQGVLHRDIKPSNVLQTPDGTVYLIDFGAAREFLADAHSTQTVMYTPGFAPPEQLSERARRGPATDLYALAATIYTLLAGKPPADAAERMAGEKLVPIEEFRIDLGPEIASTIDRALALAYAERPVSAAEMLDHIDSVSEENSVSDLEALDALLHRSQTFTFQRRACPACQGVLSDPKPLRRLQCPVCQRGSIRRRAILGNVCPNCRNGSLREVSNVPLLNLCPECGMEPLTQRRKGLLKGIAGANCPRCNLVLNQENDQWTETKSCESRTAMEWLEHLRRSEHAMVCRECGGQYDVLSDGRWQQIEPKPSTYSVLYPDEWARVAVGLDPGVGNAECDNCAADYFLEDDKLTLLDAQEDPFGFAQSYLGRISKIEAVRWLAVGKESPGPGLVCESCHTEFDRDGNYLRLVRSPNRQMARLSGAPKTMEDWHRIAAELPTVDQEAGVEEAVTQALRKAYRHGQYGFDAAGKIAWRSDAVLNETTRGTLIISDLEVSFGGRFRKSKIPIDAIAQVSGKGSDLYLQLTGEREADHYVIEPVELTAQLKSGAKSISLDASDLAARLSS